MNCGGQYTSSRRPTRGFATDHIKTKMQNMSPPEALLYCGCYPWDYWICYGLFIENGLGSIWVPRNIRAVFLIVR